MQNIFKIKYKQTIIRELNQDLYRSLNLSLYEADHYFRYYSGYIYNLIDRIYDKYGPSGLRSEIKYIIEYLNFLFNKLENNNYFPDYILVIFYFRMYYRHHSQRTKTPLNQLKFTFFK